MTEQPDGILSLTAVVIPSYNAAPLLGGVINSVAEILPRDRIIVVDDGSTDDTLEVARSQGVVVVEHGRNLGKGVALKTGINKAHEIGAAFVITLDADGQHDPKEIPRFVSHQAESDPDIIVGNRMADTKDMPPIRIFTNRFTSWVVSTKAGQKIPDSQNGYRMIRTSLFKQLHLETARYETESEILIKAAKLGARIESVPVETIYGEERSSINPMVDTLRFFRLVIKSLFW